MARPGLMVHPKFRRLQRILREPRPHVRGYLECLWEVAYEAGEPVIGDSIDVEAAAGWEGEDGMLCRALLEAGGDGQPGFIDEVAPGRYAVHDLYDHAPDYVQKRAKREAQRRQTGRQLSELRAAAGRLGAAVTNAKPANGGQLPAKTRQVSGKRPPFDEISAANGETPAPAPAPAPTQEQEQLPLLGAPAKPVSDRSLSPGGKKLRVKRSPGTFDPSAYPFPDPRMDAHPTFRSVWGRWCADRAKRKKPLTEEACRLQLAKLATWGSVAAVASIERSLECGWVGLFPPPDDEPKVPKARPTRNEVGGGGMFVGGVGLTPTPQGQGGGDDFDLTGGPV